MGKKKRQKRKQRSKKKEFKFFSLVVPVVVEVSSCEQIERLKKGLSEKALLEISTEFDQLFTIPAAVHISALGRLYDPFTFGEEIIAIRHFYLAAQLVEKKNVHIINFYSSSGQWNEVLFPTPSLEKAEEELKKEKQLDSTQKILPLFCFFSMVLFSKNYSLLDATMDKIFEEIEEEKVKQFCEVVKNKIEAQIAPCNTLEVVIEGDDAVEMVETAWLRWAEETGTTKVVVFYSYQEWLKRFQRDLRDTSAEKTLQNYIAFLQRYYDSLFALEDKEIDIVVKRADVDLMQAYIEAHGLDPNDETAWEEAKYILETIDEDNPCIEIVKERKFPRQRKVYATATLYGLDEICFYIVINVHNAQGEVYATYILWNTGGGDLESSLDYVLDLITDHTKGKIKELFVVEELLYPEICPSCQQITGRVSHPHGKTFLPIIDCQGHA